MIDNTLRHILNNITKKYQTHMTISFDNDVLTFPESSEFPNDALKIQDKFDGKSIQFFYLNTTLYATFSFTDKDKTTYNILTGISQLQSFAYPSISNSEFIEFLSIIYYLLTNAPLPASPSWITEETSKFQIDLFSKKNIDSRRFNDPYSDSIEFEKRFLDAIRRNDSSVVRWMINKVSSMYSGNLSITPLENAKFKCVGIITLISRLSINEGVSAMRAYALSDTLLQSLEKITNIEGCITFMYDSSLTFMQLIHEFPYTDKSDLVKHILQYIDNNIYGDITLSSVSKALGKQKTYISSEFKKEMGETVHAYIMRKKIFEAKHLLLFTNQSYKEVASLLNFSSQSHFITIFKSLEDMTPAEYRSIGVFRYFDIS